jgi:hypothetical protein
MFVMMGEAIQNLSTALHTRGARSATVLHTACKILRRAIASALASDELPRQRPVLVEEPTGRAIGGQGREPDRRARGLFDGARAAMAR